MSVNWITLRDSLRNALSFELANVLLRYTANVQYDSTEFDSLVAKACNKLVTHIRKGSLSSVELGEILGPIVMTAKVKGFHVSEDRLESYVWGLFQGALPGVRAVRAP